MPEPFSKVCDNLCETEKLALKFADVVKETGAFVCLYGDIGAGKTAFAKFVCKYLVEQRYQSELCYIK
jgi:tRNA A37 threonylcarbamoyladenosine biosynthesis protein TsaE